MVRVIIVPNSQPKTKPKACNFGLSKATGEYIVIFDAEDKPEPNQLIKSYLAFQKVPSNIVCLQAKLNYYNPNQNLLTRLFTAEYSLWFDLILPGLQTIGTSIPLGGTSNHFRTNELIKMQGWDPFNVTEDCDLGIRLFKEGYKTAIIDSVTLEEANSKVKNWFRQRSRWIKGYMQTYFVHMRNPIDFIRKHGSHTFIFQLTVGGKISFMLINPILWLATISYFTLYSIVGPTIESLYPAIIFYMAISSLIFGNFLYLYNYMIGCAKREQWYLIKYVFFIPFYWLMVSIGAVIALIQLIIKPHYWEKTHHGLHLVKAQKDEEKKIKNIEAILARKERLRRIRLAVSGFIPGSIYISAAIIGNIFNLIYNTYLGRKLSIEDFGLISLFGSFVYLSQIPFGALSKTVTYRGAYLFGKYNTLVLGFWSHLRKKVTIYALIGTLIWVIFTPLIAKFFGTSNIIPFIIFTPIWLIGAAGAIDGGFLSGNLKFTKLAVLILIESVSKFCLTFYFVEFGLNNWVYSAVPISLFISLMVSWLMIKSTKTSPVILENKIINVFPKKFFISSIFLKLSTISFLSFDLILAKHFLSATDAGLYALLSLAGKMIFFAGNLFSQFINPLVSREERSGRNSNKVFYKLLTATSIVSILGFICLGLLGDYIAPFLFGKKIVTILPFLPLYSIAMAYFTIGSSVVTYHQIRKRYIFPIVSFVIATFQVIGIVFHHNSIEEIIEVVLLSGIIYIISISLMHVWFGSINSIYRNIIDFLELFKRSSGNSNKKVNQLRILIFNWRDTKHVWAGGAESYLHELAKRWVNENNYVTIFCGNDGRNPRNEVVEGVQIVRRGGFYTVYIWAFLYYILKFHGLFDIVIDSANGIPFFTPLYVHKPKYLLIYHIHQEVFRNHLKFPLDYIAILIESKFMPLVYKNQKIITISESSKNDITNLGFGKIENIKVVNPGVNLEKYFKMKKTSYPSLLYLGRLKSYKNIDIAIKAFSIVIKNNSNAKLYIAGEGEVLESLKRLTISLNINNSVIFLGKVTENEKLKLLAKSWVVIQPSLIEGWGITVIEANASGTPVIASNVSGLKDSVVYKKTGLLAPVGNILAFANEMEVLISNPKYLKYLSNNAYIWSQKFSWNRSSNTFYNIMIDSNENNINALLDFSLLNIRKTHP